MSLSNGCRTMKNLVKFAIDPFIARLLFIPIRLRNGPLCQFVEYPFGNCRPFLVDVAKTRFILVEPTFDISQYPTFASGWTINRGFLAGFLEFCSNFILWHMFRIDWIRCCMVHSGAYVVLDVSFAIGSSDNFALRTTGRKSDDIGSLNAEKCKRKVSVLVTWLFKNNGLCRYCSGLKMWGIPKFTSILLFGIHVLRLLYTCILIQMYYQNYEHELSVSLRIQYMLCPFNTFYTLSNQRNCYL